MSDRSTVLAVVAAASAWLGALLARPVPWWILGVWAVVAVASRRSWVVWTGLFLLTDVLAVRALDGLTPPVAGPIDMTIALVTDPEPTFDGRLRFEASTDRGRMLVEVRSPSAIDALAGSLAGDRAAVSGTIRPFGRTSEWTRARHLVGTLRVESVRGSGAGPLYTSAANAYRRTLDRGAASLTDDQRSLLVGLVLGDDRAQPPELTADFRAAGLTHLLAVSGHNVC